MRTLLPMTLVLALGACGAGPEPTGEGSLCQLAADHVNTCNGGAPATFTGTCDSEQAQSLLDMSCAELEAQGKADGIWCSPLLRWMKKCWEDVKQSDPTTDFCVGTFKHGGEGAPTWISIACGEETLNTEAKFFPSSTKVTAMIAQAVELMDGKGYASVGDLEFDSVGPRWLFQRRDLIADPPRALCYVLDLTAYSTSIGGGSQHRFEFICDGGPVMSLAADKSALVAFLDNLGYEPLTELPGQVWINGLYSYYQSIFQAKVED